MKISPKILAPIIYAAYRLLCSTLRITQVGREAVDSLQDQGKLMVLSLWHDEVFPLAYMRKRLPIIGIVSGSNDGEYVARLLEAMGTKTARGSSSRGGIKALLRAAKTMRDEHYFACITVDGPRGPRHKVKDGAVFLAHRAEAYMVPIRSFYSRSYRFASWDKFQLPLPFTRVTMVIGEPYLLPEGKMDAEYAAEQSQHLENLLHSMQDPTPTPDVRQSFRFRIYSAFAKAMQKVSLHGLHRLAKAMAFVAWNGLPKRRKVAVQAIEKHLHYPTAKATATAKASFYHNFASFLEIFHSGALYASPQTFAYEDSPGLEAFRNEQGPLVVATAHIGSWELMEPHAARLAPSKERIVVVRSQKDKALTEAMYDLRSAGGVRAVGHRSASTEALACLKRNGLVAFLVDHNSSKKESVFLPFLEDIAAVNIGPALLALRSKATVYPSFLLRKPEGGHTLYIAEPLRTATLTGSVAERCTIIAQHYTDAVAKCVQQYPEQWFWMHKRWKTRPDQDD